MSKFIQLESGKVVVMGLGHFALGGCICPATGFEGIVYMPLAEPRERDADCGDLFPEGEPALDPAAVIYFTTPEAVAQSIALLAQLHSRMLRDESGQEPL